MKLYVALITLKRYFFTVANMTSDQDLEEYIVWPPPQFTWSTLSPHYIDSPPWSSLFLKRRNILHTIGHGERSPAAALWSTPSRLFLKQSCHYGSPLHPCGLNITGALLTGGDGSPRTRPLSKLMASLVLSKPIKLLMPYIILHFYQPKMRLCVSSLEASSSCGWMSHLHNTV